MQQMMTAEIYLETTKPDSTDFAACRAQMLARRTSEHQAHMNAIDAQCHAALSACASGDMAALLARYGLTKSLVHAADVLVSSVEIYRLHDDGGFVGTLTVRTYATGKETVEYHLHGVADCFASRDDFFQAYLASRQTLPTRLVAHDYVLAAQRRYYAATATWQSVCASSTDGQRIADVTRLKSREYAAWQQALRDYQHWSPAQAEGN